MLRPQAVCVDRATGLVAPLPFHVPASSFSETQAYENDSRSQGMARNHDRLHEKGSISKEEVVELVYLTETARRKATGLLQHYSTSRNYERRIAQAMARLRTQDDP